MKRFHVVGFGIGIVILGFALWLTGNLTIHFGNDLPTQTTTESPSESSPKTAENQESHSAANVNPSAPSANSKSGAGESPEFTLESSAKTQWSFSQSRGKKVILHFWASWCPPCLDEIKQLLVAAKTFEKLSPEFLFVVISLDTKWEDALKLLPHASLPGNLISLLDADKKVAELYGSYNYPETYLIDEKGFRLTKLVGPQEWSDDEIMESVKSVFRQE